MKSHFWIQYRSYLFGRYFLRLQAEFSQLGEQYG